MAMFATAVPSAGAEKRVALIIGNNNYPTAPLRNPVNDAKVMAQKLRDVGFEVMIRTNVDQRQMTRALSDFGQKLGSGSVGLFYYAGHGIQARGKNFLIPVDADIENESSISSEAVDVERVLDQLSRARVSMVVLDACRNNPFERRFRSGTSAGLAQIDAPSGTLIAYATSPGKVALDGEGSHGTYTEALLRAIDTPGLKVEDVFKQVRINVMKATDNQQIPWESSSLTGDFWFKPAAGQQLAGASPPGGADAANVHEQLARLTAEMSRLRSLAPSSSVSPTSEDVAAWKDQLAKVRAMTGRPSLAAALATFLDIQSPEDIATLQSFESRASRRPYNNALAIGADASGALSWGGSFSQGTATHAAEIAVDFCGGLKAKCRAVLANGEFSQKSFVEMLGELTPRKLDGIRTAFLSTLRQPIVESFAGVGNRQVTVGPTAYGYTFMKAATN